MSRTNIKKLLDRARDGHYAVGSFNAWDIQSVKNLVAAAQEERSPLIISVWKEEIDLCGIDNLFAVCQKEIERAYAPAPA